jgi:integrase
MPLTDLKIKRIVSQSKDLWLTDEKGLRLLVKPNGAKYWRLKYRFAGKQKTLAIGVYPDVGLKMARDEREKARQQLKQGIDPSVVKKENKYSSFMSDTNTFSILAKQWWEHEKGVWVEKHAKKVWNRLKTNSFKILDSKPIEQIVTKDILDVIKEIENRRALDVARRVLQDIRRVFSYAVLRDFIKYNPASDLSGIVKNYKRKHQPSMKNEELGGFMSDLEQYGKHGFFVTQYALLLLVYTFVRSGEIRGAKWCEFDFEKSLWKIPAERMKMKREHIVPLSKQAIDVLVKVQEITGTHELLFPLKSNWRKKMSQNTMCSAMRKMGYDGKCNKSYATPHGFRANATSILNEQGFNPDAIERQLSHIEGNSVRAAYIHHAKYMDDRIEMMQWWADFLCEEKEKIKYKA